MLSEIHPTLQVAIGTNKPSRRVLGERLLSVPLENSANSYYNSALLKGTELQGRNAFGVHTSAAQSHHSVQNKLHSNTNGYIRQISSDITEHRKHPSYHTYLHSTSRFGQPSFPEHSARSSDPVPSNGIQRDDDSLGEKKNRPNTALDSLETVWNQLSSTVRQTLKRVRVPITPSASPGLNDVESSSSNYYSQQDVSDLIKEIMREVQMHSGEVQAHIEMLKDNGRWDPDHLTQREQEAGVTAPFLVMRTSALVPPRVLADAISTSIEKALTKSTPMPWPAVSRFLKDVYTQLFEMLEPAWASQPALSSKVIDRGPHAKKTFQTWRPGVGTDVGKNSDNLLSRTKLRSQSRLHSSIVRQ